MEFSAGKKQRVREQKISISHDITQNIEISRKMNGNDDFNAFLVL